jgi:serine protease DegQ
VDSGTLFLARSRDFGDASARVVERRHRAWQFQHRREEGIAGRGEHQHQQSGAGAIRAATIPGSAFSSATRVPTSNCSVGLGSGVIVSTDGYILTNNHVVEGADEIDVTLNDSRHARGKVIGTDPETDLAVLKIELDKLPVQSCWATPTHLQVGDQVLAIGNPFGVGQTVTSGIVSALGRNQLGINTFENFIQTDAAINPGNSGGALVDVNGNLEGINTAIYSRSGGSMGIGFAIPVSTAKQVLEDIVKEGKVTRGWIGVEPNDLSPELAGPSASRRTRASSSRRAAERPGRQGRRPARRRDHPRRLRRAGETMCRSFCPQSQGSSPAARRNLQLQRGSDELQVPVTPSIRPSNPIRRQPAVPQ